MGDSPSKVKIKVGATKMKRMILLFGFLTLLLVAICATGMQKKKDMPLSNLEVIKLLKDVGIPAESSKLLHRAQIGRSPQVPQDVCFYRVKWKDASWIVGIDIKTRRIVSLNTGDGVAFLISEEQKQIEKYEDAVHVADLWFKRFGVQLEHTILYEVIRYERNDRQLWSVTRSQLIAPDIIVRVSFNAKIDGETGGLIGYRSSPDFILPSPLPRPLISREEAIASALRQIATKRTEHYEPSKDAHLLDCFQFITWKRCPDGHFKAHLFWKIRFYGRAKQISRLPPEFQKYMPPKVVSVLWDVLVDSETGEVDIHGVSQRNELFTNGKIYRW